MMRTFIMLLTGLMLSMIPEAGAEGMPLRHALTLHRAVPQQTRGLPDLGATEAVTCEETVWTLSREAAATGVQFMYSIGILDGTNPDQNGQRIADILYQSPITPETTFRYTFYEEGTYVLFVDPADENGRQTLSDSLYSLVHVEEGTGQNLLADIVEETAAVCRKVSDFETAVAINDWLCEHVTYDSSYTYFSPEGALLYGTGVCSAYTRAFQLIAAECGLETYRACGRAGKEGHTWNTVRMDGNWYHVDVTWNDGDTPPTYVWFGLTDALIGEDHAFEYYAQGKHCVCDCLEDNYYVHENKLETCTAYTGNVLSPYRTYPEMIQSCFDAGSTRYEGTAYYPLYDQLNPVDLSWPLLRAIFQAWIPGRGFTIRGEPVRVSVQATADERLTVQITGWDLEETGTLEMPEELETIGSGAFEQTGATTVRIPDGCRVLESRAFADSAVRTAEIPGSVTEIADDAFDGCEEILMIAEEGTKAAEYADENGILRIPGPGIQE